jgi:hypothetical protein
MLAVKSEWERLAEPEHFVHFITAQASNMRNFKEMPDNASEYCLLCVDKFTYSNRRHHCRGCGILCCDPCSSKKLCFTNPFAGGSGKKAPPKETLMERVCDGCFNRYVFECRKWIQDEVEFAKLQLVLSQQKAEADAQNRSVAGSPVPFSEMAGSSFEERFQNDLSINTNNNNSSSGNLSSKSQSFSVSPKQSASPTKSASFSVRNGQQAAAGEWSVDIDFCPLVADFLNLYQQLFEVQQGFKAVPSRHDGHLMSGVSRSQIRRNGQRR